MNELPHNVEVEQALLGAILTNNDAYDRVADSLKVDHFFEPIHQQIYEIAGTLIRSGKKASPIAVLTFIPKETDIAGLQPSQYVARLAANATTVLNAPDYAGTITQLYLRRELVRISYQLSDSATQAGPETTAKQIIEQTEEDLLSLVTESEQGGFVRFSEAAKESIDMAAAAFQKGGGLTGLPCGFIDLDALMGGLQKSDLIIVAGRPAMGKAQPLDAQVLTPRGFVPMGELKVGDDVCHPSGGVSKVLQIHPQGVVSTYRLTFADGRSTRSTADHLWSVRLKGKHCSSERVLTTIDLKDRLTKSRHKGRTSIPLSDAQYGTSKDFVIGPYALGLLLGDGSLVKSVEFVSTDNELVDALVLNIPRSIIGNEFYYRNARHVRLRSNKIQKNHVLNEIIALGLYGKRSADKFVPAEYLNSDNNVRLAVLQGLLDTDGTVEPSGTVRFCSVSRRLANDVAYLVRSLGGIAKISERTTQFTTTVGGKKAGQPAFVVSIRHRNAKCLFRLQRKIDRLPVNYQFADLRLQIKSIEECQPQACQCITVSAPDGLYVTDDFIVTHNSALAGNIAFNIASNDYSVGFFSLEMSREQVSTRLLSDLASVPSSRLRRGEITEQDFARVADEAVRTKDIPLYIEDSGGLTITQLIARARRLKRQRGLDLLIVDYLQLLFGSQRQGNRVQEVTEITTKLKALAKELDVPVIALSQLSRQVEARDDKRPILADLRESGSIEQDADVVMFVYREEYYLKNREPKPDSEEWLKWEQNLKAAEGKAEVIIGKQRHGPTGVVELQFDAKFTRFGNLARESVATARPTSFKERGVA